MISRAMTCGRSNILRQVAFTNQHLVRNLFILGISSVARAQLASAQQLSNMRPIITEVISKPMCYSAKNNIPVVKYEEVKDLPNHPEKLLIDVREPHELQETGVIPTAINIPLGIVGQELALNGSSTEFLKKYGRAKPSIKDYLIIHCRSGKRSQAGAEIAAELGYKNVHNYVGSWLDWAEHEGLPKDPK